VAYFNWEQVSENLRTQVRESFYKNGIQLTRGKDNLKQSSKVNKLVKKKPWEVMKDSKNLNNK